MELTRDSAVGGRRPVFRVLGPLEVRGTSGPVPLTGARQRVVLAALLVRANRVVPLGDLVDAVWPERPPATARDQVVNVVSALRRLVGRAAGEGWLETQPPGYVVRLGPGQLDVEDFEELVRNADAASAAGRPGDAARALRGALSLWRGPALADVPATFAATEARRLSELRLAAVEKLMDAEFAVGRHREVVPELTQLVAEYPLRERLRGQLMLALHAAGRTADALAAYRSGRRLLVDELGLEPGAALQRIERAILTDTEVGEPASGAPAGPPAQLPRDVADFTGRRAEIAAIRERLEATPSTAVRVVAVVGPPGVGKSTLVNHVAHGLRAEFPGGQLHASLRGDRDPFEVLAEMLRALGTPAGAIPEDLPERVRLYRSLTARRQLLIVLDGVADVAHARPLLPGDPGCAVLMTSRSALTGLEGAHRITLGAMSSEDAVALLGATAGPGRVTAEPAAAQMIAELCGRYPLALRVAGARAAARPELSLRRLAERLGAPERRLDELRAGDLDVRSTMAAGIGTLPLELSQPARRLALLGVGSFPLWTVVAVLGVTAEAAEDLVDQLVDRQVVEYAGVDDAGQHRYRFPELIRLYLRFPNRHTAADAWSGESVSA
jgi:DNA-binding SARP family transcriptional activator/energy-coupling factor transporter ATP-binding protein EcfA2